MKALDRIVAASNPIRILDEATIDMKDTYLNNLKARSALARAYIARRDNVQADRELSQPQQAFTRHSKSFETFVAPMTATSVAFDKASDEFFKVHATAPAALEQGCDRNTAPDAYHYRQGVGQSVHSLVIGLKRKDNIQPHWTINSDFSAIKFTRLIVASARTLRLSYVGLSGGRRRPYLQSHSQQSLRIT